MTLRIEPLAVAGSAAHCDADGGLAAGRSRGIKCAPPASCCAATSHVRTTAATALPPQDRWRKRARIARAPGADVDRMEEVRDVLVAGRRFLQIDGVPGVRHHGQRGSADGSL